MMDKTRPTLDADAAALLDMFAKAQVPAMESMSPADARAAGDQRRAAANLPCPTIGAVSDLAAGGSGSAPLGLRIYRPLLGKTPSPAVIFFHGGGWVIGGPDSHDHLCRSVVRGADVTLISLDYPLSPEAKFPRTLDLCAETVRWIFDNADGLGIDPARVAFSGDSAGGNLAAVLALMARDGDLPRPRAQALFYPVTDLTMSQPSYGIDFPGMPVSARTMAWFIDHYLETSDQAHDWHASPLLAPSFAGVAPAFVMTAGCDVLCDEGRAFAAKLAEAGAEVTGAHFPGQIHPFLTLPHVLPRSYAAIEAGVEFLVRHLML